MRTSSASVSTDPRRKALYSLLGRKGPFRLSPRDSAFALRLQRETIVWRARLDHALARCVSRPLHGLDRNTLEVLRLGATQLLILETPAHAAVSETVRLAGNPGARGLVNAVLRRLASQGEDENIPLHDRWSHPRELVERWVRSFGRERTLALLRWNNSPPVPGGFAFGAPPEGVPGLYLEGYIRFQGELPMPPPGVFVQDEASAVAAVAFSRLPGETVLEIGAAPGGKTAHQNCPFLVGLDFSEKRMDRWVENRKRLSWRFAHPVVADGGIPPFRTRFHKVLLDAPCTNTGVLRRRSEARWRWSERVLHRLAEIQGGLLASAGDLVLPGGVLFYCTCSLEPEENRVQASAFEAAHPDFQRLDLDLPGELEEEGMMVSFPPESRVDGLFAVAWRRSPRSP